MSLDVASYADTLFFYTFLQVVTQDFSHHPNTMEVKRAVLAALAKIDTEIQKQRIFLESGSMLVWIIN